MLTLNVIGSEENKVITGAVNGEKFSVVYTEDMYKNLLMQKALLDKVNTMDEYDRWVLNVKDILDTVTTDIITTSCPDLIKSVKGTYHIKVDGVISKKAVPVSLVAVILQSVDSNIDAEPIIKAWIRFLRNPNFTPQKAELFARYITATIVDHEEVARLVEEEGYTAFKANLMSTYNDVAITQEGLIVGKKYAKLLTKGWVIGKDNKPEKTNLYDKHDDTIDMQTGKITKGEIKDSVFNEDFIFEPPLMGTGGDAFSCGPQEKGHIVKIGVEHKLEKWSMVNTDDTISCVSGLHVGGWQYVQSYKGLNCQLLECFIDPAEIGALCDIGYGDGAMRVKSYFVYGATTGRNKGIYHSSHYAKIKDAEWEEYKKEAVTESNKLMEDLLEEVKELGK